MPPYVIFHDTTLSAIAHERLIDAVVSNEVLRIAKRLGIDAAVNAIKAQARETTHGEWRRPQALAARVWLARSICPARELLARVPTWNPMRCPSRSDDFCPAERATTRKIRPTSQMHVQNSDRRRALGVCNRTKASSLVFRTGRQEQDLGVANRRLCLYR